MYPVKQLKIFSMAMLILLPMAPSYAYAKIPYVRDPAHILVVHDAKKPDQPHLAVVNRLTANYKPVTTDNQLSAGIDFESVSHVQDNQYITCQSNGKCLLFSLSNDPVCSKNFHAKTLKSFVLPLPEGRYSNVEATTIVWDKDHKDPMIYWGNRAGWSAKEPNWRRQARINLDTGAISAMQHQNINTDFHPVKDNSIAGRLLSDYDIYAQKTYALFTTDQEEANSDKENYTVLYTRNPDTIVQKIKNAKAEGINLYTTHNSKNEPITLILVGTDDEEQGAQLITLDMDGSILTRKSVKTGKAYGISGIAPVFIRGDY